MFSFNSAIAGFMFIKNAVLSLIIIFLFSASLFAQNDSGIYYMGELKISQKEKGKDVTYIFNDDNSLLLRNDSVIVTPSKYKYSVNIGDINKITFVQRKIIGVAVVIGFLGGSLLGGALTGVGDPGGGHTEGTTIGAVIGSAFLGGLICGVVGGAISYLFPHDYDYRLSGYSLEKKRELLLDALRENQK